MVNEFERTENIILQEIKDFPHDSLGVPSQIYSFQDYVILLEEKLDLLFVSYQISSGEFKRFQVKGRGPDELLTVQQIGETLNRDEFCAWGLYGEKAFVYSAKDNFSSIYKREVVSENFTTFCITPDYIIGTQAGKAKRFLQQKSDSLFCEFGQEIKIQQYPPEIVSNFILGECMYQRKLKRFAFFSAFGDIFEIYDCQNTPQLLKSFLGVLPVLDDHFQPPTLSAQTKLGVLSTTSTDKYIFALYSDFMIKEFSLNNDKMRWVNKILVYDWDGNPVKIILTDRFIKAISYNRENNLVYCIGGVEDGCSIFYFNPDKI